MAEGAEGLKDTIVRLVWSPAITSVVKGLLSATVVMLVGILIARMCRRWLTPLIDRTRISNDPLIRSFFLRALYVSIIVLSTLVALSQLGWDVSAFITGLGVTGIILGFGLRDTLSNFAAGLLLLIYRPFRAGETIEVEGSQGIVEELTIVNMQMTTDDGVRVIMPNSKVWGAKIVNYSLSKRRRLTLDLKVPLDAVQQSIPVVTKVLTGDARILKTPAPVVRVTLIAQNISTLTICAWTAPDDFTDVGGDLYLKLHDALTGANLSIV